MRTIVVDIVPDKEGYKLRQSVSPQDRSFWRIWPDGDLQKQKQIQQLATSVANLIRH